jgi:hypothetical protein
MLPIIPLIQMHARHRCACSIQTLPQALPTSIAHNTSVAAGSSAPPFLPLTRDHPLTHLQQCQQRAHGCWQAAGRLTGSCCDELQVLCPAEEAAGLGVQQAEGLGEGTGRGGGKERRAYVCTEGFEQSAVTTARRGH